jgi:hypothetical protein
MNTERPFEKQTGWQSPDSGLGSSTGQLAQQTDLGSAGGGAAGSTTRFKEGAGSAKEQVQQKGTEAAQELKRAGEETFQQIKHQGQEMAEQQKGQIIEKLSHCSMASRKAAEQLRQDNDPMLAQYAEAIANQIDRARDYVGQRDLRSILRDTESFARRQPEIFFGGMLLAGLGLARLMKASARSEMSSGPSWSGSQTPHMPVERTRSEDRAMAPASAVYAEVTVEPVGSAGTPGGKNPS